MLVSNKKFKFYFKPLVTMLSSRLCIHKSRKRYHWKNFSDVLFDRFSPKLFLTLLYILKKQNYLTDETKRRISVLQNCSSLKKRKQFISFFFYKKKAHLLFKNFELLQFRQKLTLLFLENNNYFKVTTLDASTFELKNFLLIQYFLKNFNHCSFLHTDLIFLYLNKEFSRNPQHSQYQLIKYPFFFLKDVSLLTEVGFQALYYWVYRLHYIDALPSKQRHVNDFWKFFGKSALGTLYNTPEGDEFFVSNLISKTYDYDYLGESFNPQTEDNQGPPTMEDLPFSFLFKSFLPWYSNQFSLIFTNEFFEMLPESFEFYMLNSNGTDLILPRKFSLALDAIATWVSFFDGLSDNLQKKNDTLKKWDKFFKTNFSYTTQVMLFDVTFYPFEHESFLFTHCLQDFFTEYQKIRNQFPVNFSLLFNFFFFDNEFFMSNYFNSTENLVYFNWNKIKDDNFREHKMYKAGFDTFYNSIEDSFIKTGPLFSNSFDQNLDRLEFDFFNRNHFMKNELPFLVSWQWKNLLTKNITFFNYSVPQTALFNVPTILHNSFLIDLQNLFLYKSFLIKPTLLQKWKTTKLLVNKLPLFDPIPLNFYTLVKPFQTTDINNLYNLHGSVIDDTLRKGVLLPSVFTREDSIDPWLTYVFMNNLSFSTLSSKLLQQNSTQVEIMDLDDKLQYTNENHWTNWVISLADIKKNNFYFFSHPFFNRFHTILYQMYIYYLVFPHFITNSLKNFWTNYNQFQLQQNVKNSFIRENFLERIDFYEDFLINRFFRISQPCLYELQFIYPQFVSTSGFPKMGQTNFRKFWENGFELYDWYFIHFFDSRWQDYVFPHEFSYFHNPNLEPDSFVEIDFLQRQHLPLSASYYLQECPISQSNLEITQTRKLSYLQSYFPEFLINRISNKFFNNIKNQSFFFNFLNNDNQIHIPLGYNNDLVSNFRLLNEVENLNDNTVAIKRYIPVSNLGDHLFLNYSLINIDFFQWFKKDCELFYFSLLSLFFKTNSLNLTALSDLYLLTQHLNVNAQSLKFPRKHILIKHFFFQLQFQKLYEKFFEKTRLNTFIDFLYITYRHETSLFKKQQFLEILNLLFFFKDVVYLCEEPLSEFWYSFFNSVAYGPTVMQQNVQKNRVQLLNISSSLQTFNSFLFLFLSKGEKQVLSNLIPSMNTSYIQKTSNTHNNENFVLKKLNLLILQYQQHLYAMSFKNFEIYQFRQLKLRSQVNTLFFSTLNYSSLNYYRRYLINKYYVQNQINKFFKTQSMYALILSQIECVFFWYNRLLWIFFYCGVFIFWLFLSFFKFSLFIFSLMIIGCFLFFRFFRNILIYNDYIQKVYISFLSRVDLQKHSIFELFQKYDENNMIKKYRTSEELVSLFLEVFRDLIVIQTQPVGFGAFFLPSQIFYQRLVKDEKKLLETFNFVFYRISLNSLEQLSVSDISKQKHFKFYWGMRLMRDISNRNPLFYVSQLSRVFKFWIFLKQKRKAHRFWG